LEAFPLGFLSFAYSVVVTYELWAVDELVGQMRCGPQDFQQVLSLASEMWQRAMPLSQLRGLWQELLCQFWRHFVQLLLSQGTIGRFTSTSRVGLAQALMSGLQLPSGHGQGPF
jgi:hypothetical protein